MYSFLWWNLPGITMSSESLHNYFGITVKSRKNNEKFGFFDFCLWSRNNVGIITTLRLSPVNFTPKKHYDQLFFSQKKKFRPTSLNGRFPFWDRTCDPFRESKIFFSKFNLLVKIRILRIWLWSLSNVEMIATLR